MIHFQITEALPASEIVGYQDKIRLAAEKSLQLTDTSLDCDISLVMLGDEQIQALNHQYLGVDAPTDVLSFPADEVDPESGNRYLGDILIAFSYAQAQAAAAGHALDDELQLLAVHGVLHLLGYDHSEDVDRLRMWAKQADILKTLGCTDDVIPR